MKEYPAYRSAIVRAREASVRNSPVMFFSLFNHIQRKGIEMTAPVVMTYQTRIVEHVGERGDVSMEFLYRRPDQGDAGRGGSSQGGGLPGRNFRLPGHARGEWTKNSTRKGVATLRKWLDDHQRRMDRHRPPTALGYHGPMTPVARQLNEVQIPVPARVTYRPASEPTVGELNYFGCRFQILRGPTNPQ